MKRIAVIIMMVSACITMRAQTRYAPFRPLPNENQLRWQDMEMYAFIHYSLNTYTDQEWGFGNEDLKLFNPSDLDCRQWARVCKQAGMKGIIFTAKHHCGFCMWPSAYMDFCWPLATPSNMEQAINADNNLFIVNQLIH